MNNEWVDVLTTQVRSATLVKLNPLTWVYKEIELCRKLHFESKTDKKCEDQVL